MELIRSGKDISDHQVQLFRSLCLADLCWVCPLGEGVLSQPLLLSHLSPLGMAFVPPGTMSGHQLPDCAAHPVIPWTRVCAMEFKVRIYRVFLLLCVYARKRRRWEKVKKSAYTCVGGFRWLPECRLGPWDWVDHDVNFENFVDLLDTLTSGRTRTSFVSCSEASFMWGEWAGCTESTCVSEGACCSALCQLEFPEW